jgi:hypothetical protein
MYRKIVVVAVLAFAHGLSAQGAPPPTDIFLAPLSMKDGVPVVGTPVNVTHQPGYDNQPWFTPDSRSMLFTSARGETQTDIYRFDVASRATTRVTQTPESEYSATGMPGGQRFSVIRVEADQTQRLWSFANDGSDPKVVIEALKPVGYHVWIDCEQHRDVRPRESERTRAHGCSNRKIRHPRARYRPVVDVTARQKRLRVRAARRLDVNDHRDDVARASNQRRVCAFRRARRISFGSGRDTCSARPGPRFCRDAPARRRGRRSPIWPPQALQTSRAWR